MAQNLSDFIDAISLQLTKLAPDLRPDQLRHKCRGGVVFWSDLDLAESFRAIGLSDKQIAIIEANPHLDRTPIIQQLLEELARTTLEDGLTHVYNRRYFERSMNSELDRSRRDQRPCGLVLLDIDHFKKFNDTYGHDIGDLVLKSVANTINDSLRSTDTVSRVGGEEFAIIVPNTFRMDASYLAERIRQSVEELRVPYQNESLQVTISLGVAINDPKIVTSLDAIYKRADNALYEAKNSGRNCVRFSIAESEKSSSAVTADERNELLG